MSRIPASPLITSHRDAKGCAECTLSPVCLPLAMPGQQLDALDSLVQRSAPLQRGEHLYLADDAFEAIYVVRSGALKVYTTDASGEEQVTGFYLPGEILGLDGIMGNRHVNNATALETTAVCTIPFRGLEALAATLPSLQHHFFQLMSREIQADQQLMLLLSKRSAEERIASLMLSLSARHKRRRLSEACFRLPMSRQDIGNHLGLSVETVSRGFTRLQQLGILAVSGKEITISDRPRLCALAAGMADSAAHIG